MSNPFPSGCCELDRLLHGGVVPGRAVLLAATSPAGQARLVEAVANGAERRAGAAVLVFSSGSLSAASVVAARSGVPADRMLEGMLSPEEMDRVVAATTALWSSRLSIVEALPTGLASARAQVARLRAAEPSRPLLVIVADADGLASRPLAARRLLQRLAEELEVAVVGCFALDTSAAAWSAGVLLRRVVALGSQQGDLIGIVEECNVRRMSQRRRGGATAADRRGVRGRHEAQGVRSRH